MPRKFPNNWKLRLDHKIHDVAFTRYSKNGSPELDIIFEWKTIGHHREVVSVCIKSAGLNSAVTATDIRSIPFSILETMERQHAHDMVIGSTYIDVKSGPQSGKPLTVESLEMVAELYRGARNIGVPTARHIAKQMDISESTARKRISAARKAGLLGAALGTKVGEGPKQGQGKKKLK